MLEGFPRGVRVDPVVDTPVTRLPDDVEGFARTEGGLLRAEVRAADHHNINDVPGDGVEATQVLEGDLHLAVKEVHHEIRVARHGHIPLGNIAHAFGGFEEGGWHKGDVAQRGAVEVGDHGTV